VSHTSHPEIVRYYAGAHESERLQHGPGELERDRTREIIARYIAAPPARVLDVGGGAGVHALWLLEKGYEVELIDPVPLHVEQARSAFASGRHERGSARVGDARALEAADDSADAVLMLGPLYHLADRADRVGALSEARRTLRPGGFVFAAGISRFASMLDGYARDVIRDPAFASIVEADLETGQHRNTTDRVDYFTTAYFHRPDELRTEAEQAGLAVETTLAIEGPFWGLADFAGVWRDEARRSLMLRLLRTVEAEPSLLGASAHLMLVARKGR
jgi:ubiquinone/menaquinone biosynthesis C-methylase UbiE